MKKISFITMLLMTAMGQAQQKSHIKTTIYKTETSVSIAEPSVSQAIQNYSYFDRLGRPVQHRAHMQSDTGKDIVTHIEYDASGRQSKGFLPYVSSSATKQYDANAAAEVLSFYASPTLARTGNPDFEATANPYSEKQFEASPFGRVSKQASPGSRWLLPPSPAATDHTVRMEYLTNATADQIRLYRAVAGTPSGGYYPATLTHDGFYGEGTLYKYLMKDENWTAGNANTVQEYKNKKGQVILKRKYGMSSVNGVPAEGWHDTYYVYDQFGNLAYVLPPMSDGSGSAADLDGLCYQYRYDGRNRLVEKKEPGKDWEFIIYDNLGRPVATGPAYSPFSDSVEPNNIGWLFTKYDVHGRIAYTGWMQASVSSADRHTLQTARDTQTANLNENKTVTDSNVNGVAIRYSNQAWPTGPTCHILSVNYYDDYNFPGAPASFPDIEGQPVHYNLSVKPKGLPTGSWIRALETVAATSGETGYILYDYKARPIRTWSSNYLGGYTQQDARFDFSGKTLYTVLEHKRTATGTPVTVREDYTYSDQGRLLTHTHKIGSRPTELLAMNGYDEMGQLVSKRTGGTDLTGNTPLQKIDYSYTVRGWLKEINKVASLAQPGEPADLFAYKIVYDSPEAGQAQFNGNISETYWRTANDNILRRHAYQFDGMGRLTSTSYHKPESVSAPDSYKESQEYDKNGNIRKLQRYGEFDDVVTAMMIDDLVYAYQPNTNRIAKVTDLTGKPAGFRDDSDGFNDNADDYTYDINGNIKSDQNKNIDRIAYNHLNQPIKIIFSTGATIEYLYNAAGEKLRKVVTESPRPVKVVEYLDGFDYVNGTLEAIATTEGYVKCSPAGGARPATFNYVYNYHDHLGNVRLSYTKDPATGEVAIMQENNYYSLGLSHRNYNMTKRMYDREGTELIEFCPTCPIPYVYNYGFNGQEFQEELGLNLYDMPSRDYDPAIGRWTGIDPVVHHERSPYNGHDNNPAYWSDPSGADVYNWGWGVEADGEEAKDIYKFINALLSGNSAQLKIKKSKIHDFTHVITLQQVTIEIIDNNYNSASYLAQDWVYRKSGYYEYHFKELREKRWTDFQRTMDYMGTVPGIGEPFDAISGIMSAIDGDWTGVALSTAAIMPIGGQVATAIKIQRHHIIPKAVYKKSSKAIQEAFDLNGGFNLKKIPAPFHGNHPQYSIFVTNQLNNLKEISPASIKNLQKELSSMINQAYDNYKSTGQNLNEYFRQLNAN
jgi:RHS repeat-associated protein